MFVYLVNLFLVTCITASETPIVGVLSQEAYLIDKVYPEAHSFIAASYVKILESSGARVVPVWIGQNSSYYERVVKYTNGILFPGGGTYFNETGGYGEAAKQLYELAIKSNDEGVHYPLWGVCLGLQVLMFSAAGDDIRKDCESKDVALPLNFVTDFTETKLFANASPSLIENLKRDNLTYNYHRYCIFEQDLKANNLLKDWRIISTNVDVNGVEFVSTMEHKSYPFYATQYHPEKMFEYKKPSHIPHCFEAVRLAQYLGNFFVDECRQNNHTFPDVEAEAKALIYNYNPVYSAANTSYDQLYLFQQTDYEKNLL